jgi:putative membrane protein
LEIQHIATSRSRRYEAALLVIVCAVLLWSGIRPRDRFTWLLEVFPALIAVPVLILTRNRFRFTPLVYTLVAIHACILMVGGKYTYAEVPLFNWIRDTFHLSRNHYDRVGHFAQGFVPAMVARELLLRTSPLQRGKWLTFLVICICMAISATYELFEWLTAVVSKEAAESFLGTQGDNWDTQKDMGMAMIGAVTALVTLSRLQDRELEGSHWSLVTGHSQGPSDRKPAASDK